MAVGFHLGQVEHNIGLTNQAAYLDLVERLAGRQGHGIVQFDTGDPQPVGNVHQSRFFCCAVEGINAWAVRDDRVSSAFEDKTGRRFNDRRIGGHSPLRFMPRNEIDLDQHLVSRRNEVLHAAKEVECPANGAFDARWVVIGLAKQKDLAHTFWGDCSFVRAIYSPAQGRPRKNRSPKSAGA